jgi:hypothetical protein
MNDTNFNFNVNLNLAFNFNLANLIGELQAAELGTAERVDASFHASLDESDVEQAGVVVDEVEKSELFEQLAVVLRNGLVVFEFRHEFSHPLVNLAVHRDLTYKMESERGEWGDYKEERRQTYECFRR